jgi:uncharacterized protein (TIGR01627 family)
MRNFNKLIAIMLAQMALLLPQLLFSLPQHYHKLIKQIVSRNPQQLSTREYALIAENLFQRQPCNMLVFGVGNDSCLWMQINKMGNTVFLENEQNWLQKIQNQLPAIKVHLVSYNTLRSQWLALLSDSNENALYMDLPKDLMDTPWDIIFVDGPAGYDDTKPGRMKSIYMASLIAKLQNKNVAVFVHDCDRIVEATYCDTFFDKEELDRTLGRLRFYLVHNESLK